MLREGPKAGVYSICLDSDERLLPAECQAVVAAGPDGALTVAQMNEPAVGEVRPEYVTPAWADQVARSIAPVRDISAEGDDAGLPDACRLLDVLGLESPAAEAIAAGWQASGRSTYAVIGACYDGPFGIDLRRDGPHALIGEDELTGAIASLAAPAALVIDDADLLTDCEAGGELSKIITRGGGRPLALVLAGDPDTLASGFGGWQADARRARRGCLTAPGVPAL